MIFSIAQIASELQGYDPQCLHADDASALLERLTEYPVTDDHTVPLAHALGRVLAHDVVAPAGYPSAESTPFLLQKGELLAPAALGLVASLGLKTLQVLRPLRVAYVSDISDASEQASVAAQTPQDVSQASNRYALMGLLERLGVDVVDGLAASDTLHAQAQHVDAIITCQAWDALHTAYTPSDSVSWHLAMQPGGQMTVARIPAHIVHNILIKNGSKPYQISASSYQKNSVLFQLPSEPVAAMVAFWVLVRPALLRMMGANAHAAPLLQARCCQAIEKQPGYSAYPCGIVFTAPDGNLQVSVIGNAMGNAMGGAMGNGAPYAPSLHAMAHANGLIVLRHEQCAVAVGDLVEVMMLDSLT